MHDYFVNLFNQSIGNYLGMLEVRRPVIMEDDNLMLCSTFLKDEFCDALFQMILDKSPRLVLQKFWSICGDDVFNGYYSWLNSGELPIRINDKTIVLISKCDNLNSLKEYRPISFCNVICKILSKVLANKLKRVLLGIINKEQ